MNLIGIFPPVVFINIEGNIAPEDCFLSRQIVEHPAPDAHGFFEGFIERVLHAPAYSNPLYAASLKHKEPGFLISAASSAGESLPVSVLKLAR